MLRAPILCNMEHAQFVNVSKVDKLMVVYASGVIIGASDVVHFHYIPSSNLLFCDYEVIVM